MNLPKDVLLQHILLLGKTRAGKSSVLRGTFVEPLLDAGEPVCIIDPKGDHWGLKSSADGKHAGYPVVIFGGEHADVPINEHSGGHIAELVATGNRPCIIDLGGWMVGERTRFFISFASTLFKLTRGRRWLVIDECHNFAPQGKILDPDAGKMLHWANRLASEGSGKGIGLIAASQRPQKVHKDFVTSMETLIAMRVIHKLDRDAIKDWIDGCADINAGKEVIATLAGMQRGEAWVWSPEIDFGPKRIKFPFFKTYDSFKPQEAATGKLKGWAEVDLEDVKSKLAAVVEEAKANDPAELRKRIRELERQAAEMPVADAGAVHTAHSKGFSEGLAYGKQQALATAGMLLRDATASIARTLSTTANALSIEALGVPPENPERSGQPPSRPALAATAEANRNSADGARSHRQIDGGAPLERKPPMRVEGKRSAGEGSLPKVERALLTVLAQRRAGATLSQLAICSGYSGNSSSFHNGLGALRSKGFVNRGTPVQITADGMGALGSYQPLPTGAQLREYWYSKLGKAERTILQVICKAFPKPIATAELSRQSGYSDTSSSFHNALGKLRTLELITRGEIRASEDLF